MQIKTIKKVITRKLDSWLSTIADNKLREDVRKNLVVSGGSITSLLQNIEVNDYDIYIQDMDVLIRLATYYCPGIVLDGRKRDEYLASQDKSEEYLQEYGFEDDSQLTVLYRTLKPDQVKLQIPSGGRRIPLKAVEGEEPAKYQASFLSQNAISLTDDIQIVLRFSGTVEQIHKTFDFIHATNYFTYKDGVVTNIKALESIITKTLRYQGSLYPITSIIRIKKFLKKSWTINAGEMLKMMFQVSQLDLTNIDVIEEQLIGVDVAYFSTLVEILRGVNLEGMTAEYLNTLIDKVFNEDEGEES